MPSYKNVIWVNTFGSESEIKLKWKLLNLFEIKESVILEDLLYIQIWT